MSRGAPPADDLRQSLAGLAAGAEQRNRPRAFVLLATLVLLAGVGYAWSGLIQRSSSRHDASAAQRNSEVTLKAAAELKALIDAQGRGAVTVVEPTSQLLSRIEAAGPRARLKKPIPVGTKSVTPARDRTWNLVKVTYSNIKDQSLESILAWIRLSTELVPGMDVSVLTVRPEATEWSVSVTFSRYERTEGSS